MFKGDDLTAEEEREIFEAMQAEQSQFVQRKVEVEGRFALLPNTRKQAVRQLFPDKD